MGATCDYNVDPCLYAKPRNEVDLEVSLIIDTGNDRKDEVVDRYPIEDALFSHPGLSKTLSDRDGEYQVRYKPLQNR